MKEEEREMLVILLDMDDAIKRFAAGEKAYEYKTEDPKLRLLGPACGFGRDTLRMYREQGLYAEDIAEAEDLASARKLTITGVWFVKPPTP
ncbi:MAG: hypothetical protein JST85_05065 [Acidobacteria bacterium]|nr:hypothetical protein [Acidobacteriota bacterium]